MPANTLSKNTAKIGFIGLGLMGTRLTQRLHSSGWNVQAWNRSPDPARAMSQKGIRIAASLAELVADSDVVLSCLANDAAVHSVYLDKDGGLSAEKPGTILLEISTISPQLSRLLHQEASIRGLSLLDLAISGSTPAVDAGRITLFAGGERDTFEQCIPIYEFIAKQWFLIGRRLFRRSNETDRQPPARRRNAGHRGSRVPGCASSIESRRSARCSVQNSGHRSGICGEVPEDKEQRLLAGIPIAADEQRYGSGHGDRRERRGQSARGIRYPIRACLQPSLKWRLGSGSYYPVCRWSQRFEREGESVSMSYFPDVKRCSGNAGNRGSCCRRFRLACGRTSAASMFSRPDERS